MILLKFFAIIFFIIVFIVVVFFWNIIKTFFLLFRQMKRGMGADARMQGSYRRQTRPHASDKVCYRPSQSDRSRSKNILERRRRICRLYRRVKNSGITPPQNSPHICPKAKGRPNDCLAELFLINAKRTLAAHYLSFDRALPRYVLFNE